MNDPVGLSSMTVEPYYNELAESRVSTNFVELPLQELRKRYTSDVEKEFLQKQVIDKQVGVPHPQDCVCVLHMGVILLPDRLMLAGREEP